jgi:hypothetical protein
VTQLVLRTLPAPHATGFHVVWPWTMAAGVVGAWQVWAPDAPNAIAASLLMRTPTDSDLPPFVTVLGAVLDQESPARAALDEFVADVGAPPIKANYAPGPYREIKRYLAEYDVSSGERRPAEREPGHSYSKSEFFRRELPADVIAELLARFADGGRQREARVLDFTPWAGAYNRVPTDATAFAHRAERFLLKQEVVVDAGAAEAERQAVRDWLSRSWALVHAWGSGGVYPNFPDPERSSGLPALQPAPDEGESPCQPVHSWQAPDTPGRLLRTHGSARGRARLAETGSGRECSARPYQARSWRTRASPRDAAASCKERQPVAQAGAELAPAGREERA